MNVNADLWPVHRFVDGLVEAGLKEVVISPGSRNTPLVIAFAEHPEIRVYSHMDERSAAFFALGLARGAKRPVAITCTSGTAVANYYPAVMEAYEAHVPLIVITADRPPSLRDIGANQAVRQPGAYASHVKWSVEMPIPDGEASTARHAASVAVRAAGVAVSAPAGPVHINYPFVEPLMPPSRADCAALTAIPIPKMHGVKQWLTPDGETLKELAESFLSAKRPLIIVGPQYDKQLAQRIQAFAKTAHVPIMADPLSQIRSTPVSSGVPNIAHYDLLLNALPQADTLDRPDFVLRFGAEPTSRPLSTFMRSLPDTCRMWLVEDGAMYRDASLVATDVIVGRIDMWLEHTRKDVSEEQLRYVDAWLHAEALTSSAVDSRLQAGWAEAHAVSTLVNHLSEGTRFFIGNSRPIRDLDALMPVLQHSLTLYANRGVSGIDGIVSTAFGIAASDVTRHCVLCIGDVSFYHDLNGLLAANRFELSLTIVLIHNRGGGIFQHLSQAGRSDTLSFFTTPHALEFEAIVSAYGGHYEVAVDANSLSEALASAETQRGLRVIEVRFDNDASARWYKSLREDLAIEFGRSYGR